MKWDALATTLVERWTRDELVDVKSPKRLTTALAAWLADHADEDDELEDIGDWLIDQGSVNDVFGSDDVLAQSLREELAKRGEDRVEDTPDHTARLRRVGFAPMFGEGEAVARFRGAAHLRPGEAWPVCGRCGVELPLFAEIALATLPAELAWPHTGGYVQLFYCPTECEVECQAWDPFAKSTLARWIADGTLYARPDRERIATAWAPLPAELPAYAEEIEADEATLEQLAEARDNEDRTQFAKTGDKLVGWPAWVQSAVYPRCPQCRTGMRYLFQLESNQACGHQFGDLGAGHIFQCVNHPDAVAFGWACH